MKRCLIFGSLFIPLMILSCGGGGGGAAPVQTVTLSGTVYVGSSDLGGKSLNSTAWLKGLLPKENTPASGFTVEVYKVKKNGEEEATGLTATTADDGTYTIENVPVPPVGNGSDDDYYYIIRAKNEEGSLEVRSPTAPIENTTVDVSPETTIVAKMLTSVASIPETENLPMPQAEMIEDARKLASVGVDTYREKTTLPLTAESSDDNNREIAANALGTAWSNTEWVLNAVEAQAEAGILKSDPDADTDVIAQYLERLANMACQFDYYAPLFRPVFEVLAEKFKDGEQYTPQKIVEAYNANRGSNAEVSLEDAVKGFKDGLEAIETHAKNGEEFASPGLAGLFYIKRSLSSESFDENTKLDTDQATAFLISLFPESEFTCDEKDADFMKIMSDLTGNTTLKEPQFVQWNVWNASSVNCGEGKGLLQAEVKVYAGDETLQDITISGGDLSSPVTLSDKYGDMYRIPSGSTNCVNINKEAQYTITANFTAGEPLTITVTRNHPQVPEVTNTFSDGSEMSSNAKNPSPTTDKRPMFKWEKPEDVLAQIEGAPEGSRVKYTYEFAYVDKTDDPIAPISTCGGVNIGGARRLYDTNYFMLSEDCDVEACAVASGKNINNLRCRMNIQTYLVDQYDSVLAQAPGNFRFFCVRGVGDCPAE